MNKLLIIATFFIYFSNSIKAQLPVFTKSNATYSHLTAATRIAQDSVWDDFEGWKPSLQKIPLGFTFRAFGNKIDTFLIRDGALFFDFNGSDTEIYIGSNYNNNDFIDKGWGTKNPKSPIRWKRDGSAGNYILKLEWQNFGFYEDYNLNGSCKDSGNMQIWVYQNSNKIEMYFGKSFILNFAKTFPDKASFLCAKFDNFGKSSGIQLDGIASNPTSKSFADTSAHGLKSWPIDGTVYTFSFTGTSRVNGLSSNDDFFYSNQALFSKSKGGRTFISIVTVEGKTIFTGNIENGMLKLPELKSGIYTAIIAGPTGNSLVRFVAE